ncbi:MAG: TrbI/VirB10 family protein [Treponema sp.]|nr:TrbI/VirB10 family protein [Treponema sp.]
MNTNDEDIDDSKVSEFSPDDSNPYDSFLSDEGNEASDSSFTSEDDIVLPDFLNSSVNVSDFEKNISNNSSIPLNDEFVPSVSHSDNLSDEPLSDVHGNDYVREQIDSDEFSGNTEKPFSPSSVEIENSNSDESEKTGPSSSVESSNDSENKVLSGDTSETEKEISFTKKISAEEAEGHKGRKPKVLNKKFLLASLIIVIGGIFVAAFLMPSGKKNKNGKEKPVAYSNNITDYSAFAKKQSQPSDDGISVDSYNDNSEHYSDIEKPQSKDDSEVEIPPLPYPGEQKKPYVQETAGSTAGNGGTSVEIPDTRNDSLQSKRISGIKGLSSTQSSYSTDYEDTLLKNTAGYQNNNSIPSKEEYINSILNAYGQAAGSQNQNSYFSQNDQSGKNKFFSEGRLTGRSRGEWLELNSLWQGTIFEAVLTSELNTDLPGEITARIAKNIYSSQDGRFLLIPQNSILYGTYNSSISYSQRRVQVAWHTLIRPDGYQIQLGNMSATDAKGAAGLKGIVNDHPLAYVKAIALMSVFSIANIEFAATMKDNENEYLQNMLANAQDVTTRLGDKLIDRAMDVQPTIKIKSGTKINIVVNQNLFLPPCEEIEVTQRYMRQK